MEKKILHIPADGVTLYAEQRGQGPLLVVMPDGTNDCEPYAKLCELMADEYTVVTFDPRGGSRSMPQVDQKVTAEILAGYGQGLRLRRQFRRTGRFDAGCTLPGACEECHGT